MTNITVLSTDSPEYQDIKEMFNEVCKIVKELAIDNSRLREKEWLSLEEAATLTPYSPSTIRRRKIEIGYKSDEGKLMFFKPDLKAWMARGYYPPKAPQIFKRGN